MSRPARAMPTTSALSVPTGVSSVPTDSCTGVSPNNRS